jgi:hypothetical protein
MSAFFAGIKDRHLIFGELILKAGKKKFSVANYINGICLMYKLMLISWQYFSKYSVLRTGERKVKGKCVKMNKQITVLKNAT